MRRATEAKLVGSSLGGGFLKRFGVYVGLRLELNIDGETIVTAPIFSVAISPMPIAGKSVKGSSGDPSISYRSPVPTASGGN